MKSLRLSGIEWESIVDGPGVRAVVFAQGCPHRCEGCHNKDTWDSSGGFDDEPSRIIEKIKRNRLVRGITLSGGEPFAQPEGMAEMARLARESGYHVMTYTGYTIEALLSMARRDPHVRELLTLTDVLVDGPFVQSLKRYDLIFKGSSNQRMIDARASLERGEAVEMPAY